MINKDFFSALEALESEKGIKQETFIEILEAALTSAYKKNFGEAKSAYVKLIPDKFTIKVYAYKTVVEVVEDPEKQISLEDAKLIAKSHKVGDTIIEEVTPKDFGRIAAQTAKHVIMQRLQDCEKQKLLQEINGKESELVTGQIRRIDGDNIFIEIGGTTIDAVMNKYEQVAGEKYEVGQRIKVFVKQIKESAFGPQICVSRKNVGYVRKLLEMEIPEIEKGEIVIKNIVREAGFRTKVAVQSQVPNLDAVGACIGNQGARIKTVTDQLNGERIDVIPYSDDNFNYIAAALSPAEVISVEINNETMQATAVVPESKLSLAIGKGGQNVKLASKLTGWRIDIKTKSDEEIQAMLQGQEGEETASENGDVDISTIEEISVEPITENEEITELKNLDEISELDLDKELDLDEIQEVGDLKFDEENSEK